MVHLKRFESCRGNVSRRSLFHKAEALPREILSKTLVFYFVIFFYKSYEWCNFK